MPKTPTKSAALRQELVAIAGTPNWVDTVTINDQKYKVHYWWTTTKGVREGDWASIAVAADKASDLGLTVYWIYYAGTGYLRRLLRYERGNLRLHPTTQELANAIAVWIEY